MAEEARVLAVVTLGRRDEMVVREARRLADERGARLVVAHVLDYGPGLEPDYVPILTPAEQERAWAMAARHRLIELLAKAGAYEAIPVVVAGPIPSALAKLALSWRPEVVVIGQHERRIADGFGQGPADLPSLSVELHTVAAPPLGRRWLAFR